MRLTMRNTAAVGNENVPEQTWRQPSLAAVEPGFQPGG